MSETNTKIGRKDVAESSRADRCCYILHLEYNRIGTTTTENVTLDPCDPGFVPPDELFKTKVTGENALFEVDRSTAVGSLPQGSDVKMMSRDPERLSPQRISTNESK